MYLNFTYEISAEIDFESSSRKTIYYTEGNETFAVEYNFDAEMITCALQNNSFEEFEQGSMMAINHVTENLRNNYLLYIDKSIDASSQD